MPHIIEDSNKDEVELLFDFGDAGGAFKEYKSMIESSRAENIGGHVLTLIKLLRLRNIDM